MKRRLLLGGIIFVLLLSVVAACSEKPAQSQVTLLEHKLAVINAGHFVEKSDVTVQSFHALLESLQKTTGYDQEKIGDMVVKTRDVIKEKSGKEIKVIQIMEAADKAETVANKSARLEDYLAVYAALASK